MTSFGNKLVTESMLNRPTNSFNTYKSPGPDGIEMDCNDFCRCCGHEEDVQSVKHILCSYSSLSRRRPKLLGTDFLGRLSDIASIDVQSIDKFAYNAGCFQLVPELLINQAANKYR